MGSMTHYLFCWYLMIHLGFCFKFLAFGYHYGLDLSDLVLGLTVLVFCFKYLTLCFPHLTYVLAVPGYM